MSRTQETWLDRAIRFVSPVTALNRQVAKRALASYDMADRASPLNRERDLLGGPGDRHLKPTVLWDLRETSRSLMRTDGLARGVIDRSVENVIGPSGFDLKPATLNEDLNKQLAEDWLVWLATCDVRREVDGWQLFRRAYREQLIAGDNWCEFDPDDNDGDGGLFFFEGERVVNPAAQPSATTNGVKFDARGRKVAVWVSDVQPSSLATASSKGRWHDADNLVQWWNPERSSQSRGCPVFASLIREFDDLDDLLQYEMMAAKWMAANPVWIESDNPMGLAKSISTILDDKGNLQADFRPGPNIGPKGSKPHALAPARPSNTFNEYVMLMCRMVGLPLGLPLELVLLDFSRVNFASSRQLLNQAQRHFMTEQNQFAFSVSKIYRWWLQRRIQRGFYAEYAQEIASGRIYAHSWGTPRWPSPNPLQDAQAAEIGILNAFESRTNHNRNRDVDQAEIAAELARESAAGATTSQAGQGNNSDIAASLVKLAKNAEQRAQEAESGDVDVETWSSTARDEIATIKAIAVAIGAWRTA